MKTSLVQYEKDVEKAVKEGIQKQATSIAAKAKSNCNIPSIAATIRTSKEGDGAGVSVGQGLPDPELAAYHEFGTGDFARATVAGLPEDWSIYAWSFKKRRDGRLPASPYFYPAVYWANREAEKYLKDKINNI